MEKKNIISFIRNKIAIVIIVLCCFSMYTCTNSCSSSRKAKKATTELVLSTAKYDSIITVKDDSIKALNGEIRVLMAKLDGLTQSVQIQSDAMDKISSAKKNINVVVNDKRK